jgi:uncharacterized protein (DUF1697 family)
MRFIGLLRGINVGGRSKVAMAELRALAEELGWTEVETYIQSGNLLFEADGRPAELEDRLEKALSDRFGVSTAVIVRRAEAWHTYVDANPFEEASATEPNRVLLGLSKQPPRPEAAAELQARATAGERVVLAAGALWVHYPAGVGTSKLSPSLTDRLVGSPVTARNWRTVVKLEEMAKR